VPQHPENIDVMAIDHCEKRLGCFSQWSGRFHSPLVIRIVMSGQDVFADYRLKFLAASGGLPGLLVDAKGSDVQGDTVQR
jgi:hypothetical protein